jgi:N-acetylglucosaminyldiphosphoundecaprenol N-acetyl-beta-D-mannosaminyltransferase
MRDMLCDYSSSLALPSEWQLNSRFLRNLNVAGDHLAALALSQRELDQMSRFATSAGRIREDVLQVSVDVLSWSDAEEFIFTWAFGRESRTVCICDVHSVITARWSPAHAEAIKSADLVTPDGAPVAWVLRKKGHPGQERISGPDLMWNCCRKASKLGTEMLLYGGTQSTLQRLEQRLRQEFRGINIVGALSPPFRDLSAEEDAAIVDLINRSGARIVWVGLGCPKQEAWMWAHHSQVKAVMVGVGAAFDFHAGVVKRAPLWMQRNGLEWLHRVSQDPHRLARRYLVGNSVFVIALLQELLSPRGRVHDA